MALMRQLPLPLPPPGSTVVSFDVADLAYAILHDGRVVGRFQEIVRGVVLEVVEKMSEQEVWLAVEEAAAYVGLGVRTFERYVVAHPEHLSHRRTGAGGRREWSRSQLDAFLVAKKKPRPPRQSTSTSGRARRGSTPS